MATWPALWPFHLSQEESKDMEYRQLLQAKAAAVEAAKALQATANGRLMSSDEQTQFDAHMATAENLQKQIAASDRLRELERGTSAAVVEVGDNLAEKKPWKNSAEFFGTVIGNTRAGRVSDPRLQAALGSSESVPADGGFAVPTQYAQDLLQRAYDVGEVAKRCRQIDMTSARLVMNAIDESSREDGKRWGGLQAFWESEAKNYQGTKPKTREVQFVANKLLGLAYLTEELMEDTQAISSYIDTIFPDEFSFKIDDAIFNGLGAGQPLGVLNSKSGATIVQAKEAGQAAASVVTQNILSMWSRLYAPSRKTSAWFIEQSVEPWLYRLQMPDTVGTAQTMLYTPPGFYGNNSDYGQLLGRPVIPIEQASALGTQGDMVLADMNQYILAKRNEIRADSSIHVAFLTGETALRFMVRLDGQSWWNTPLTPKAKTAPTRSPFITLAARS
jgi:HK97 family phage major capsid protein